MLVLFLLIVAAVAAAAALHGGGAGEAARNAYCAMECQERKVTAGCCEQDL